MKEPYRYDLASQPDPESCAGDRKVAGEALTGAHAGQPLSSEITESGVPTQSLLSEGYAMGGVKASRLSTPRSHRPCACVETPCAGTGRSSRHPWIDWCQGSVGAGGCRTSDVYVWRKSDALIVPGKRTNEDTK